MLPHDLELERAILGIVPVRGAPAYLELAGLITPTDFYRTAHGRLWQTYEQLREAGEEITLHRAHQAVTARWPNEWEIAQIAALIDRIPRSFNVRAAADQLRDLADRRRLQALCARMQHEIVQSDSAVAAAGALVGQVRAAVRDNRPTAETLEALVTDWLVQADETPKEGIRTGLPTLDRWGCGLRPGELVVLAGRPSHGKSALALQLALTAAASDPATATWIVSLEMPGRMLAHRALASEAQIGLQLLRRGTLDEAEYRRVGNAVETLSKLPVLVDAAGRCTLDDLRRHIVDRGPGLLVVDYLQLLQPPAESRRLASRVQEIGALSRGLKAIAAECNFGVLALSQLSRAVEHRSGEKSPVLADLRDSGDIEQDADQVWLLWRPSLFEDSAQPDERACLRVAKHRNGPTGTVELLFDAPRQKFVEKATQCDEPPGGETAAPPVEPSAAQKAMTW